MCVDTQLRTLLFTGPRTAQRCLGNGRGCSRSCPFICFNAYNIQGDKGWLIPFISASDSVFEDIDVPTLMGLTDDGM